MVLFLRSVKKPCGRVQNLLGPTNGYEWTRIRSGASVKRQGSIAQAVPQGVEFCGARLWTHDSALACGRFDLEQVRPIQNGEF